MKMFEIPFSLHENSPFDTSTVISITVFFTLICLCIIIGHLLEENRWANESNTSLLLLMDLSGILTVFFCAVVMSPYTWHNVSESSRITSRHAFVTMSFIAETFIFLYVGVDALDIDKWKESSASAWTFLTVSSSMLALVLIGRAAFVFPLASIVNGIKKKQEQKINFSRQVVIWWAGLMRGAVFETGLHDKHSYEVFGTATKPLIKAILGGPVRSYSDATDIPSLEYLHIPFLEDGAPNENGDDGDGDGDGEHRRRGFSLIVQYPTSAAHHIWRRFDNKFMRPVFGGRGFVPYEPASPTGAVDPAHER